MKTNPLRQLEALGQSIWLDYIQLELITSGKLKKLIDEDGLGGMTSNPSIFEKIIADGHDFDQDITKMTQAGKDINTIYAYLTQNAVRLAADTFRDLYNKLEGEDGYVSLEVNPHLAHDTEATLAEARHLWKSLDRPNVFIKVPATREGLPVIRKLISEGINVNVTLLFGLPRYREVAEAYIAGLEDRAAAGGSLKNIASVASFFLSRIDVLLDPLLEKIGLEKLSADKNEQGLIAKKMEGQVAIASAKIAYQIFHELFNSARFKKLIEKGAGVQRLLWASTGTKNPNYSDVKYVEALIGPQTVNTLPVETFDAYRDHGKPQELLNKDIETAQLIFQELPKLGINIDTVTQQLENEGVDKFNQAFDQLMAALKTKSAQKDTK
jgi:transaldolase